MMTAHKAPQKLLKSLENKDLVTFICLR